MNWADWFGGKPSASAAPTPEVATCARKPLPKVRARASKPAKESDDYVPASNQVPKIVVDFADMSEPTVEPVFIHVYDVGPQIVEYFDARKQSYNPFYTAIEVCATEYSFGMSVSTSVAEIHSNEPRQNSEHKFRLTIPVGYTSLPPREVLREVKKMEAEWNKHTFSWKSRNCHHFTDALCGKLGTRCCPVWLHQDCISSGPVFLRVYNLGQTFITRWHNNVTKSYGAYHTGVEVYGREWAFGVPGDEYTSAVGWCPPGECAEHDFREMLYMGSTTFSPKQVEAIIADMRQEWTGPTYDMFTKNCHKFSQAFCNRLGVAETPSWINDLAEALAPVPDSRPSSKENLEES